MFVVAAATAVLAVVATPASATSFTVFDAVDSGNTTGPAVRAQCGIDAALLQATGIQFVVTGSAEATNTNVTPAPLATHVHCVVKTRPATTALSWGGPSGDGPGAQAVAAGTSDTVPFDKLGNLYVCAYGTAFFQGGLTVSSVRSAGC